MKPAAVALVLFTTACSSPPTETKRAEAPPAPASITQFYASPAVVAKGERTLLCYGVEGAAAVRLEPAVDEITPSLARCIEAAPAVSTKYTLFARNRAGAEVSRQVEVTIDPKAVRQTPSARGGLILFFTAMQGKVSRGAAATLCYGVKGADSVTLSPAVLALVPSERMCFQVRPEATTNYALTASAANGAKDSETVRIAVE